MKRPKTGLALGGGGARGIAHVGVIKALEQHKIPIDLVAGTSIGAIIGGSYAMQPDAALLERTVYRFVESTVYKKSGLDLLTMNEPAENFWGQVARSVRERIVINLAHSKSSIVSNLRLKSIIDFVLQDANIEQAKVPLAMVATDLNDGHDVVFHYGSLRQAAMASSSIPGFLPPVDYMGYTLVDGAVTSPVPVDTAFSMGADIVVAVDVGQELERSVKNPSIVDIIFRTNTITSRRLRKYSLGRASVILRPEVGNMHWADFSDIEKLIRAGENAVTEKIEMIFSVLNKQMPFWRRFFGGWSVGENNRESAHGVVSSTEMEKAKS